MVQIFKVFWCIRMIETHGWYLLYFFNLDANLEVFCHDVVKHRSQIVGGGVHPVGIDLHPVLEIFGLFRYQREHGAHDFKQLHVTIKSILIASLYQHLRNFLDDIRHSTSITRDHIIANFSHLHHFRH